MLNVSLTAKVLRWEELCTEMNILPLLKATGRVHYSLHNTYERSKSARDNFGKFIHQFQPGNQDTYQETWKDLKFSRQNMSLLFNQTCLYIYIYIYISRSLYWTLLDLVGFMLIGRIVSDQRRMRSTVREILATVTLWISVRIEGQLTRTDQPKAFVPLKGRSLYFWEKENPIYLTIYLWREWEREREKKENNKKCEER